MLSAVLLILGSISVVTVKSLVCPPPHDIAPCICSHNSVFCYSSTTTTRDLERVLKTLYGKGTLSLSLKNINLGKLPLGIYKNASITEIKITDCQLEGILDDNSANGYSLGSYLKVLQIRNSINDTKEKFRMDIFSLKSLKTLEISRNFIPKLRSEIFATTPITLTNLTLKDNRIETVAAGAFDKLTSLERLNLDQNKIKTLTRSTLPCANGRLKELRISYNKISSLPEDFFWNMYFLTRVNINNNSITEFSEETWSPVWSQLNTLLAYGNPLICDSRIEWMFKLGGPGELEAYCDSPTVRKSKSLSALISKREKLIIEEEWTTEAGEWTSFYFRE